MYLSQNKCQILNGIATIVRGFHVWKTKRAFTVSSIAGEELKSKLGTGGGGESLPEQNCQNKSI